MPKGKNRSVRVEIPLPSSFPGCVTVRLPDSVRGINVTSVNGRVFTVVAGPVEDGPVPTSERKIHFVRKNGAPPHRLNRDCTITVNGLWWDVYLDRALTAQ